MKKRWKIQKGETPRKCAYRNLREVVEALIDSYIPDFRVSLAYDNDELFITEPYTTGERLPYEIMYTMTNESYDLEGVLLDDRLKPDKAVIKGGMIVRAGRKAYEEILADELYLFLAENL